jgi:uncharacterized membrane protein YdjX (TVP38/TMEM64 family)
MFVIFLRELYVYAYVSNMGIGPALQMFAIKLQNVLVGYGILTPLIFILLYALRPLILFPASVMTITSVFVFGLYGGFIVSYVGEMLSAIVAYFVGKYFGKTLGLTDKVHQTRMGKYFQGNTFTSVLILRLIPVFAFDLVNYASGVARLHFAPYFYATLLGVLPGLSAYIFLGYSFMHTEYLLLAVILLILLFVLGGISRKHHEKKMVN